MQIRTPREISEAAASAGTAKAQLTHKSISRLFWLSIMGGMFVSLGALLSVIIGYGFPGISSTNPAIQKFLTGLTFPVGLTLIVVLGAELFTGNNALLIPAFMRKTATWQTIIKNWTIVWIGNFAGAIIFTILFAWLPRTMDPAPYTDAIRTIAETKANLAPLTALLRGIAANWCVCLAIWLALSAKTLGGKVLGCWIPVATFAALGFEHSIANMFFIPCGMFYGANVTILQLFTGNLLIVTIGNIIGGALLVGTLHTTLHRPNS